MALLILFSFAAAVAFYLEANSKGLNPWKWSALAFGLYSISFLTLSTIIKAILKYSGISEESYIFSNSGIFICLVSLYSLHILNKKVHNKSDSTN